MKTLRILLVLLAGCACASPRADAIWRSADRSWFADAPGCSPRLYDDFVDDASWNGRRLLPRDCRLLEDRAPLFSWTEPPDRDTAYPWTLTLRDGAGKVVATRETRYPRLMFDDDLVPGAYTWSVRYSTRGGMQRDSAYRHFAVADSARSDLVPSPSAVVRQVGAKARPRLVPAKTSLSAIGAAARGGEYLAAYKLMMKTADDALASAPARNPDSVSRVQHTNETGYNNALTQLRNAAGKEAVAIEALSYAWHFTGENRYRDAAVTRLRNLASWSPDGSTSEQAQDQANRNAYLALASGADLLWNALNDQDRREIGRALRGRLGPVVAKFNRVDAKPYDAHLQTAIGHATTALALAVGLPEFPEAADWLARAWELHVTQNFAWGEEDGGMGNGTAYSWYGLINLARSFAELRAITGADFMARGYARRLGNYILAFTPTPNRGPGVFGDETETDYLFDAYASGANRLYALMSRQPQHAWYWRQNPGNLYPKLYVEAIHYLMEVADGKPVAPQAPTRANWVFEDVGQAAFHSDPASPQRSSLFFRSSRFGAWNHSHADQNSFVFHVSGVPLLVSGGYYPDYGTPHHTLVGRATRYKNALTFDGGIGQGESTLRPTVPTAPQFTMDARGALIAAGGDDRVALATGDATLAYRGWDAGSRTWAPLLDNAVRSVAYLRGERVAVIYDWATSASPRRWELNYHAFVPFDGGGVNGAARLERDGASACISHHGVAGTFSQRAGFEIPPERPRPQQYHGRFTVAESSREFAAVTVIREGCRDVPVQVNVERGVATVQVGGTTLRFDRRSAKWQD